jgi:hypothetical protein
MSGSSGSSQKTGSSSTTSAPWGPVQPGLQQGINATQNLWNAGGFQAANTPYGGQTVAGLSPLTQQSINGIQSYANNGNAATNAGQNYITGILGGNTSGIQPLIDNTRNAVNASYEGAGRYGSGANDKAVANGVGTVIANQMGQAAQLAPTYAGLQLQGQQALNAAGGQQQQQQQQELNAAQQKYWQQVNAPQNAISQYMNLLQGANTGGTSSTVQYGGVNNSSPWLTAAGVGSSLLGSYLGGGGGF